MSSFLNEWSPRILSVLRIVTGFLFLWHGSVKLFGFPHLDHPVEANALMTVAGILEFGGGILILLGLFTRPVAFILSGQMAVAYFMAHAPGGFLPIVNQGEPAALFCFIFFYLFFAGGGKWSLDNLIWNRE